MGTLNMYRCNGCGERFSAEGSFSLGWYGDVYAIVVCPEHGIGGADTGFKSRDWASVEKQKIFPCRKCGTESPVWDAESCPKCGSEAIEITSSIQYD